MSFNLEIALRDALEVPVAPAPIESIARRARRGSHVSLRNGTLFFALLVLVCTAGALRLQSASAGSHRQPVPIASARPAPTVSSLSRGSA